MKRKIEITGLSDKERKHLAGMCTEIADQKGPYALDRDRYREISNALKKGT